jgi:hypothetical protein
MLLNGNIHRSGAAEVENYILAFRAPLNNLIREGT